MSDFGIVLSTTILNMWFLWIAVSLYRRFKKKPLKTAMCQCGHENNFHLDGEGACRKNIIDDRLTSVYTCECSVFVEREKDAIEIELERILKK